MWGLDLSGTPEKAGGIGGALGVRTSAAGLVHVYAYDGNGNVVGLKDATTLTWSARYEYGPFGELIRGSSTTAADMAKANPIRFSTKYQDNESELLYYGYRFYNASTGRWLNRDPIDQIDIALRKRQFRAQEMRNLYCFLRNESVRMIDPFGLEGLCPDGWQYNGEIVLERESGDKWGPEEVEVEYDVERAGCYCRTCAVSVKVCRRHYSVVRKEVYGICVRSARPITETMLVFIGGDMEEHRELGKLCEERSPNSIIPRCSDYFPCPTSS